MNFGMVLFPQLTQLDLTGPFEVLCRIPNAKMHLIARDLAPVVSDCGLAIVPTTTFADAPPLDLLFVPGGPGQITAHDDGVTVEFIRTAAANAQWITSVCSGALLLGAAGLLRGYRATTHWAAMELLPIFGAEPVDERVVVDRNRITGGGVTAGIDFGLVVAATIGGRELAESIQLLLEYDPAPPFNSGHPRVASPELVAKVRARLQSRSISRREQLERTR